MLSKLFHGGISAKGLSRLLLVLFVLSLLPLIAVALYNYPADDDFQCTLPLARAWMETGSLGAVLEANTQRVIDTYNSWQGDFFSTFLFGLNPLIFNIRLYFLSNWAMLALVCLSLAYLWWGVASWLPSMDRSVRWLVYVPVITLILQFMPSIGYSIYWHNGGQYTTAACMLYLALGLALRLGREQSRARYIVRSVLLVLDCFALGGSFFGPALGALVLILLLCAAAWYKRSRAKIPLTIGSVFFIAALAISMLAPGNALRQTRTGTGEAMGVLQTLVVTVLDSFDLCGSFLTPQLLAVLMIVLPALWIPLRESKCEFRHPVYVTVMLYGLFSATLAPGIYTGYGYQTPRYLNAIYLYFVLFAVGSAVYWEGALIRLLEKSDSEGARHWLLATKNLGKRFGALYLALAVFLLAMGGFAFTIMNTSSANAVKSLLNGDARTFQAEMRERQEYIRVTDSDVVDVKPLSVAPYLFKNDRLPWQGIYGTVRYMKWYFELFDGTAP